MRKKVSKLVQNIDKSFSMHDFRMVRGETHTNLIFDVVVPYDFEINSKDLINIIQQKVFELDTGYYVVITIDKNYV